MSKEIRYLSKRRFNPLIQKELNSIDSFPLQSVSNVARSTIEEAAITFETSNTFSCTNNLLKKVALQVNEVLDSDIESDTESLQSDTQSHEEQSSFELQENTVEIN